jgi:RimJ/RimL family protein N-acetyltransferase
MTDMARTIQSKRLELISMTPSFLETCLAGDVQRASFLIGLTVSPHWMQKQWLMQLRLDELRQDPSLQPWLLRAIGLRQGRIMAGHIGFHTAPAATYLQTIAPHGVEFGYTIYPSFRRQGYATEAADALMKWAHRTYQVQQFVLSISPTNIPSLRIAEHFGFRKVGSHFDDEDGPEDIYVRDMQ